MCIRDSLRDMPIKQARAVGTVVLEKTILELQGEPCLALDELAPQRKGLAVTRSSGVPMFDFDILFEAISAHATRAAEKLRQNGLVAGTLTVFYHTNRHRLDRPQYASSRSMQITPMSSDTFELVRAARCVRQLHGRSEVLDNTDLLKLGLCWTIYCHLSNARALYLT